MKKIVYLLLITLLFVGCKKNNETTNEVSIKGKWKLKELKVEYYDADENLVYTEFKQLCRTFTIDEDKITTFLCKKETISCYANLAFLDDEDIIFLNDDIVIFSDNENVLYVKNIVSNKKTKTEKKLNSFPYNYKNDSLTLIFKDNFNDRLPESISMSVSIIEENMNWRIVTEENVQYRENPYASLQPATKFIVYANFKKTK